MIPDDNQPSVEIALQLHQARRLQEAHEVCRQILEAEPLNADAMQVLGVTLARMGQNQAAVQWLRRAVEINPNSPQMHSNLGNVLKAQGQLDQAIEAYQRAIALQPGSAVAYNNLGSALLEKGQIDAAMDACRTATALRADLPEAHANLGSALWRKGDLPGAAAALSEAIKLRPNSPKALHDLGIILRDQGQLDAALAAHSQAIRLHPNFPEAYLHCGNILRTRGMTDQAMAAYRRAIELRPDFYHAHTNLGIVLRDEGLLEQAIAAHRQAIALRPDAPEAHYNLGSALHANGNLDEALAEYRQTIALLPNSAAAYHALGVVLKDKGRVDEAVAAYRRALAIDPGAIDIHSNLIFALHYHPDLSAADISQERQEWNRRHAQPLAAQIQPHDNDRDANRRLRIGYISADFCAHACAHSLVPLLENHDRSAFSPVCYSLVTGPDAISHRLRPVVEWHNIVGVGDEEVAQKIRRDRIDILVDLMLHTGGNRLLVLARKPAPVQVTWLGYPGSTGLSTIDYRISDPYLDPSGIDESVYSEQTVRLADTFWCYDPLGAETIAVSELPATCNRHITFGCLNNFCKINSGTLDLWGPVLRDVANSRLLLMAPQGDHRQWATNYLARLGIDQSRIEFVPRQSRQGYFELYQRIDIGLDTVPYNGHTTSLDSFYMGVPVVTLAGNTVVGRAGTSQLMNLGLADLIAHTPEQFVQIATALAQDRARLADLRRMLRQRMERSPLMDGNRFAHNMEAAYREIWRRWCDNTPGT